jgi:heterodisulfide reductase subunit C
MHFGLENILFLAALVTALYFFRKNVLQVRRNILLGKETNRTDRPADRWKMMFRVAMGQSKMQTRPVAGFFHFILYAGFILINIEMLEIVLDGLLGTHRLFAPLLGGFYNVVIGFFEFLAVAVVIACVVFLYRRNIQKIPRFHAAEMSGWPFKDANNILFIEIALMSALLGMNAVEANFENPVAGPFLVSGWLAPILSGLSEGTLHILERTFWWVHILGILAFLNYLPFSKHFHIMLAFPNVWFAKLQAKGQFDNNEAVKEQVALMIDPSADPYAAPAEDAPAPERFGAKDVMDLKWVNLLNAYSCTECGRCTSECPANQTGKKLSPRKIMMDTRDRLDEVGLNITKNNGTFVDDGKSLLDNFITREELWACTTCNACVEACPVNIDPLDIIMQMRQYLVMEESAAPQELNLMMANVENNGAPWQFAQADRANWISE